MTKRTIAFVLAALHLIWTAAAYGAFRPVEARIVFLKGRAEVQKSGSLVWEPAALKMTLGSGDKISTQEGAELEIKLDDGSVLKMRDKGLLAIDRMEKQKKPMTTITSLQAMSGKVLGCVRKLASKESKFNVVTPTAVAGIRGTVFAVFVEGDSTELDVVQGQVAVAGETGREVLVGEKQSTVIAKGDSARSPVPMAAAKLAFIMMWGGAAVKIGSLGAAAAGAWYTSTAAIVGGAAAVAVGTAAAVIISSGGEEPAGPAPATPIPNPPGWPK
jgi:ferric-dicitrate binding protein FerR (iron transport regulator)